MNAVADFIEQEFAQTERHALRGERYSELQLNEPDALEPLDAIQDIRELQATRIVKELLLTVFREPAHTKEVVELDNEALVSLATSRLFRDEKINEQYVRGFVNHVMESGTFDNDVSPAMRAIHSMARREFRRVVDFLQGKKEHEKKRTWKPREQNYRAFLQRLRMEGKEINLD